MTQDDRRLAEVAATIADCRRCGLCETRNKTVPGEGPASAMVAFVAEAPGEVNDQLGRPFVGHGGRMFDRLLQMVGLDRKDVFVTNILKCRPPDNRNPAQAEIESCTPYLHEQLGIVAPKLTVALGAFAARVLSGEPRSKLVDLRGQLTPLGQGLLACTYHPNGVRYVKGGLSVVVDDVATALDRCNVPRRPQQGSLI